MQKQLDVVRGAGWIGEFDYLERQPFGKPCILLGKERELRGATRESAYLVKHLS